MMPSTTRRLSPNGRPRRPTFDGRTGSICSHCSSLKARNREDVIGSVCRAPQRSFRRHALETGRLRAILDVTEPEVLPPGHPLYFLPNVLLTPHMAGSMGTELRRLGASALREALRVQQGEDILHPVPAQEVSA